MGTVGLALFAVGGVGVIIHLFLYEWNREASKEAKWLIAIGFTASTVLTLIGATLCAYTVGVQGVTLPEVSVSVTPYTMTLSLFALLAIWFWVRRGLFNKVVALTCVYALLILSGIAPNPAQSDHPWPVLALVGLIGLRWLF